MNLLIVCIDIFHEHMYGNVKLLTDEVWKIFQRMFEKNRFEIYEHHELVKIFEQTNQQKEAENRKLTINELTERIRNCYWRVKEKDNVKQTEMYIQILETSLDPIIMQFNK